MHVYGSRIGIGCAPGYVDQNPSRHYSAPLSYQRHENRRLDRRYPYRTVCRDNLTGQDHHRSPWKPEGRMCLGLPQTKHQLIERPGILHIIIGAGEVCGSQETGFSVIQPKRPVRERPCRSLQIGTIRGKDVGINRILVLGPCGEDNIIRPEYIGVCFEPGLYLFIACNEINSEKLIHPKSFQELPTLP